MAKREEPESSRSQACQLIDMDKCMDNRLYGQVQKLGSSAIGEMSQWVSCWNDLFNEAGIYIQWQVGRMKQEDVWKLEKLVVKACKWGCPNSSSHLHEYVSLGVYLVLM